MESASLWFSGFLFKLVLALAAGYGNLPHFAGQAQARLTFRTAEVLVLAGIFHTHKELADTGFKVFAEVQVLFIFSPALGDIPGKHTEDAPDIGRQPKIIEHQNTGDAGEQGKNDARDQQAERKLVRTVAASHKAA